MAHAYKKLYSTKLFCFVFFSFCFFGFGLIVFDFSPHSSLSSSMQRIEFLLFVHSSVCNPNLRVRLLPTKKVSECEIHWDLCGLISKTFSGGWVGAILIQQEDLECFSVAWFSFWHPKGNFPPQKSTVNQYPHIYFRMIAHVSLYILLLTVRFLLMESKENKSALFLFPITPSSCSVHHSVEAFKTPQSFLVLQQIRPSKHRGSKTQANIAEFPNQWIFKKDPRSLSQAHPFIHPSSHLFFLFFSVPCSQRSRRKAPK